MVREIYAKIRGLEYLVRSKPLMGATGVELLVQNWVETTFTKVVIWFQAHW
jgi:hypothetical protein